MNVKNLLFTLLLIALNTTFISAQTVFYNEDFTSETGKGVVGPTAYTYDTTGVTWVIDVSATSLTASTDYFKVNASEQFESKDVDGEAIWYTPIVDISSYPSVDLSADVAETAVANNTEYIRVYYKLDGGTETLFSTNGDNTNTFTSATAIQDSLIGSTVQIVIRTSNNAGTKTHTFDNISVTENISNIQGLYDLPETSSINLHWTDPVSIFDEILVVANSGSAISAGLPTGDGTAYTANSTLGSGTALLGGTVLYKGALNALNFTGVTSGNTYYVKIFTRKGTSWSHGYERTIAFSPPGVGDVLITEYARHASTSDYSYIELYNTTGSDISLAGAKMIVNNAASLSQVVDLSTDISGTIVVPANGFLILNRNRSQAFFETEWGVDLSSTGYSVNYNRTDINNFGNDKKFVLKIGGTEGADDGTIIDETKELTGGTGKRVFQLPIGYWTENIDNATTFATPGSFYVYEDITKIQMAYASGAWHAETGYAHSAPSASTGATGAVVIRGDATFADGATLNTLAIWPDAGTSLSTETVTISTGLYVANNGSLTITSTGSVTCSGEIVIERNGHNATDDYNVWGSPFASGLRVDSVFTAQNNCDFYVMQASDQSWKHDYTVGETIDCAGFSYTINSGNVISSPEGTPDGMFDVARGYFIVGNTSNEYDFKMTSGATLNNGDITANIYGSSGAVTSGSNDWNLLSNPYPSAVSIDDFLTTNTGNITNAVYLFNPNTGRDISTSYITYNSTDAAYIASCQGFYVDASTTTDGLITTLSFDNSMRSNSNDGFRSALSYFGVYLKAEDTAHVSDQTRLYFDIDALDELDSKFDAQKMENTRFNFCSKWNDNKLVFNGMPSLTTETKVIPLYFQTNETSIYTISLDSLIGSFSNKEILLEDRLMRKFYDLKTQSYSFSSQPKEWANRFYVHIIHKKDDSNTGTNGGSISGTPTSVNDVVNSEIIVFNEGDEIIITSLNENILIKEIQLLSITGQVYFTGKVNDTNFRLDASTLSNGVYLINYTLVNGVIETKKIMIQ